MKDRTKDKKWSRKEIAINKELWEEAEKQGMSQRDFEKEHKVPRGTLQHWLKRGEGIDDDRQVVEFFESESGLAFLHRLIMAIHFVMGIICGCGERMIKLVLELSGLDLYVANSEGSRHKLSAAMEKEVIEFGRTEKERLGKLMAPKRISVCQDETFHPEICLVAIEPVSNYILLETYVEKRDSATWTREIKNAILGLPITIIQSTSDEAKGILTHVREGAEASHSPDLFHVQHDLNRATSLALSRQVKQAEEQVQKVTEQKEAIQAKTKEWEEESHGPGRRPNFKKQIGEAESEKVKAEEALSEAQKRQENARQAIRGIGWDYHPFDLSTGEPRSVDQVVADLVKRFNEVEAVAEEASLPERCHKRISKARRVIGALRNAMTFFIREVFTRLNSLGLEPEFVSIIYTRLIPAFYLTIAAGKASLAETRIELKTVAENLHSESSKILAEFNAEMREYIEQVAKECAELFQRSDSCVEGRNGTLDRHHHSLHRISKKRLESLTVVHNYFIERPDGTTAAERFFGLKHQDLFQWLLCHLDMPVRPRRKRSGKNGKKLIEK